MKTSDISTLQVLVVTLAVSGRRPEDPPIPAPILLAQLTGAPGKVATRALEREVDKDFIDYGTSVNFPWLTEKGRTWLRARLREWTAGGTQFEIAP